MTDPKLSQPLGANDVSDVTITEERLDWHILTLEATKESARSIWQNEQLAFYRELLRHRAQAGWQPIESAPRDSSKVLVGHFDIWGEWTTKMAWWRLPYEAAPAKSCWWCYDGDKTLLSADVHFSPEGKRLGATHWKPLPPPPKVTP